MKKAHLWMTERTLKSQIRKNNIRITKIESQKALKKMIKNRNKLSLKLFSTHLNWHLFFSTEDRVPYGRSPACYIGKKYWHISTRTHAHLETLKNPHKNSKFTGTSVKIRKSSQFGMRAAFHFYIRHELNTLSDWRKVCL